ncbi:AAA family ATPase [Pseudomonas sp. HR96]|uniref:AAA family ATPase n=1 Tax=Pseudomonas sp. HR96 TaxID=1027966 RepID=UPI002A7643AE|nr:AAA family ATPase [Pseudomonas sp. HR96]WPO98657.1 AAA family ATPase [Pseudomonas sp. HR96]
MKILAIRLKNLASLAGPFELDFTAEPLASAGLFAITGPTGAGKSTLLDALCLALFGAVPRLNQTGRDAKVPDGDGEIATGDPRTLLRRGTGTGFAEVDFVGIDGHRYRARWEANRARDKAGGKLQPSKQSLLDLDSEQVVASQKREYEIELEKRLGLNFAQFTRAVLLAQSEFSAFLKANDNERSELLEKLTDTALYTQLGKRAFEKSRDAEKAVKELRDRAGGIAPLAVEARDALDAQYAAALLDYKAQQAALRQLEQQVQRQQEGQRLTEASQAAATQLAEAEQGWQALAEARVELLQLEQLAPQRHLFERREQAHRQWQPLAGQIALQQRQQAELQQRQVDLQTRQSNASATLAQALEVQNDSEPLLRQAFAQQAESTRLAAQTAEAQAAVHNAQHDCEQGQAQLQDLQQRQQASTEQLEQIATQLAASQPLAGLGDAWDVHRRVLQQGVALSGRLRQGRHELPALEQRAGEQSRQVQQLEQQWQALHAEAQVSPQQLGERLQESTAQLHEQRLHVRGFEELQRHWLRLDDLAQQQRELADQQRQLAEQREQRTAEGLQVKQQHQQAEQALAVTVQLLGRQRLARSASVEQLRAQLQDDRACPVCGSLEHPYHLPEALNAALGEHDDSEEAAARLQVERLATRLTELRVEVSTLVEQQKRNHQQEQAFAELQTSLSAALHAHPQYPQLPDSEQAIWLGNRLQEAGREIAALESTQQRLLAVQQQATRLQLHIQQAREASQAASAALNEQQRQLLGDQQRLDEDLEGFVALLPAATLQGLREEPTATFMALDQQLAARLQQLDSQREEQRAASERQRSIDQLATQQAALQQRLAQVRQQHTTLAAQRATVAATLASLLGEHADAEHWQSALQGRVQTCREEEAASAQGLQDTRTQSALLASELKASEQHQADLGKTVQALDESIALWRSGHPQLDDAGLARLLTLGADALEQRRLQVQQAERAIEQARVLLAERQQRQQAHQAGVGTDVQEEQLHSQLLATQQACAAGEERCADLRAQLSEDQRRVDANAQLQHGIDAAQREYLRWARISEVIGSQSGDRFRKIAQACNLDLLVHHANVQLRQLVRRYRLKRGGSLLGLLVLDTEMGDELRSVHSLSGGETFLVSLALALGLASMASSTLKIESLFIDEGFGSLDPESLQLAMDALDGLQAQGRKVAVISHVQEMHERIPVQIQVKRLGNGLSAVQVVG